jgi:hypothetical protein
MTYECHFLTGFDVVGSFIKIFDDGPKFFASAKISGNLTESLILAQDERWRRALSMQIERPTHFGHY